jgi:uncharacterized protein YbjT (DUF2867 family)
MKIVVVGGTGLIGSRLVERLREAGHEPLAGLDALTGGRLIGALRGAQVVVDAAHASSRDLLAAETAAGVGHHVTLSVVGADRLPESRYFRAKAAQEHLVRAGPVAYTIVRATQCFECIGRIADLSTEGNTVRLSPALVRPHAAHDVATALADVAVGAPLEDTVELAGPEALPLDDLARRVLRAGNDPRLVTADVHARYLGAELDDRSLAPGNDARIAPTRFGDWLSRSGP